MTTLLTLLLTSAVFAQDTPVKSLKTGDALPGAFRMFVVNDERFEKGNANLRTGKIHCYICEAELNPTIAVFSRSVASPESAAVKVAKALNPLVTNENKSDRLGAFVAFLTLGKEYHLEVGRDEKAKTVAEVATQAATKGVPYGLAAGKSAATDLFGLKETDDLTIIFFDRMKVVKIWTFAADKAPGDAELKELTTAIKTHLKK